MAVEAADANSEAPAARGQAQLEHVGDIAASSS